MNHSEEQNARARDFQSLLNMDAWGRLKALVEERITQSRDGIDSMHIDDLDIAVVTEERGFRNGLKWVIEEAGRRAHMG